MFSRVRANDRKARVIRWPAIFLATVLVAVLGPVVLSVIFIIVLQESRVYRDWQRRFNKRILNPAILSLAGRPSSPWALVHHVGRRSGQTYATPVRVRPTPEGFIIPLPYGSEVDWCRNVLAAGGCTISWPGHDYAVREPDVVDLATVLSLVPLPRWRTRMWSGGLARGPLNRLRYLRVKWLSEVPEGVLTGA